MPGRCGGGDIDPCFRASSFSVKVPWAILAAVTRWMDAKRLPGGCSGHRHGRRERQRRGAGDGGMHRLLGSATGVATWLTEPSAPVVEGRGRGPFRLFGRDSSCKLAAASSVA